MTNAEEEEDEEDEDDKVKGRTMEATEGVDEEKDAQGVPFEAALASNIAAAWGGVSGVALGGNFLQV